MTQKRKKRKTDTGNKPATGSVQKVQTNLPFVPLNRRADSVSQKQTSGIGVGEPDGLHEDSVDGRVEKKMRVLGPNDNTTGQSEITPMGIAGSKAY